MRDRPSAVRPPHGQTAMLVAIAAAGFNLQTAIAGVGPVLDDIRVDMGMSSAVAGLLQTVPFVCIALFALTGLALLRSVGAERIVAYALALVGAGALLRAAMPVPALLLVASAPLGLGVALLAVGLPAIVKSYFPTRGGFVTGLYVAALSVGSALAAGTAVPLAHGLGSWRWVLAATAVPAAIALPLWVRATRGARGGATFRASLGALGTELRAIGRPPQRALTLAVLFAAQSVVFAAMISWLATLYRSHGWSAGHAALAPALISIVTIPAALLVPARSDGHDRRPWVFGTACALAVGTFAIAFIPTTGSWLWVAIFGFGTGAIFPLLLSLPLDLAEDGREAGLLTAWMLGIGYCFSSAAPAIVGAMRDATGGFTVPTAVLGGVAVFAAALSTSRTLAPRRVE